MNRRGRQNRKFVFSLLRLLTHVKVSVRCLFKDDQFSLLVWLLLSLLFLCFHIQKQLILHSLAINPSVLIELHLRISNMHHLIVGQVGIKIITSITGVRNQTRCREYASTKMEGPVLQTE